jgi:hypothetical protein
METNANSENARSGMEAGSVGKRGYGGKGWWIKYWACLGCWISPCYGPSLLGGHFEAYELFISLVFKSFSRLRWTAGTESVDTGGGPRPYSYCEVKLGWCSYCLFCRATGCVPFVVSRPCTCMLFTYVQHAVFQNDAAFGNIRIGSVNTLSLLSSLHPFIHLQPIHWTVEIATDEAVILLVHRCVVTCLLTSAYLCICLHVFVSALRRVNACLSQTHASFWDHGATLKKPKEMRGT